MTELDPDLGEVTNSGNQSAFGNFLTQALIAIQEGDIEAAIKKLKDGIARTDGCIVNENGEPDGKGKGMDWITDCDVQLETYTILNDALNALTK